MITLPTLSVVPRILENLIQISKHVTTLNEVNDLDRALSALETRFDIPEEQFRAVGRAFVCAQERICPPPPPVITPDTKFVVLYRSPDNIQWNLYDGPRLWADAVAAQRHAMVEHGRQGHEYQIALFCPLPAA